MSNSTCVKIEGNGGGFTPVRRVLTNRRSAQVQT